MQVKYLSRRLSKRFFKYFCVFCILIFSSIYHVKVKIYIRALGGVKNKTKKLKRLCKCRDGPVSASCPSQFGGVLTQNRFWANLSGYKHCLNLKHNLILLYITLISLLLKYLVIVQI